MPAASLNVVVSCLLACADAKHGSDRHSAWDVYSMHFPIFMKCSLSLVRETFASPGDKEGHWKTPLINAGNLLK